MGEREGWVRGKEGGGLNDIESDMEGGIGISIDSNNII